MPANQVRIAVKVHAGAQRNAIAGQAAGVWRIHVAAPADKGKANRELIAFLSECLGIRKDDLSIVSGHASPRKVIAITGLDGDEIAQKLSAL